MCASHTGEDKHVRTLQGIFRRASVSQALLRCGTEGAPADALTAARLVRDGETASPIRQGCSGFHAASLLLSAYAGWSLADYTDPAHPSQVAVRETVARLFGRRPAFAAHQPGQLRRADLRGRARGPGSCLPAPRRPGRLGPGCRARPVRTGPACASATP